MEPYSVRLVIRRTDQPDASKTGQMPPTFEARWIDGNNPESEPFPLVPPITESDAADLRWYLEKYAEFVGAGTLARAHRIEGQLDGWGKALFRAAFGTPDGTNVYRNMMDAEERGQSVLLTLGTAEPKVLVQPWELLNDGQGPLAFRGVSIRRQLVGARPYKPLELRLPLRVLMIVSRPTNSGFIDPRTSVRPVLDALDRLPRGSVEAEFCEPPTLSELERRISKARKERRPFHIVHFDGHGAYLPKTGVGALAFEDDDRQTHLVPGPRLGRLISRRRVPLMILEACHSSDLSDQPVFGSVAPALLDSGVASVLAFSHAVHIEAATLLVERFYSELAEGLSIGEALSEARVRLEGSPKRWLALGPNPPTVSLQDWFVPQLYQVGPDLALLAADQDLTNADPQAEAVLEAGWESRLHGFPPEPTYRFQGRAKELLDLGRAFDKHVAVVVAGMGGMGKTALSREAAAWWLRAGRFDTAVFCSFEQVRSVERVVQLVGQALEGLDFLQRSPEEQRAVVVQRFRSERILVVWDNFESTLPQYQSRPVASEEGGKRGVVGSLKAFEAEDRARLHAFYDDLTQGKPMGRLLVTCRPEDTGLPRIKRHNLQGLTDYDTLHLLTAIADFRDFQLDGEGYEREAIEGLLKELQHHPLSISLVAPHLASLTPETILGDFAGHLDRFRDDDAKEGRNRSLRASLAFSASHLSEEARAVLPYLAWFQGGAFENNIRGFAELEPEQWLAIRRELEATALVRVEELAMFTNPFIRFHPTLPFAAQADDVLDLEKTQQRFLAVYLNVSREVDQALSGQTSAAGMELMAREELNARTAIELAFRLEELRVGWYVADTLQTFLEMAGRRPERDSLATRVKEQMPDDAGLDLATCAAIRSHAETLFAQGNLGQAVASMQALANRLETEGLAEGGDPGLQLGRTYSRLGQILDNARQPEAAIEACRRALRYLQEDSGKESQGSRSVALGTLANALTEMGRLGEALEAAEQGLEINESLGRHRNAASGHGRCAQILAAQGRHGEADRRYEKALDLARRVGDLELQGIFLQHQGVLSRKRGDLARSAELLEQAVGMFQQANDQDGEMGTYDLLASTEMLRGHFDAAEAWYERSRNLSLELGDRAQLAATVQNLGILLQTRAEKSKDSSDRDRLLHRAIVAVEESLAIELELNNQVGAAASHSQLGSLQRLLGEFEQAEESLQRSLEIRERLELPEVWRDYASLAQVADDRGDTKAAVQWAAKRDAKQEQLRQLAGGGSSALPEQASKPFLGLAQAIFTVRSSGSELPPEIDETLTHLDGQEGPLASAGAFLRSVADGGSPTVPPSLPDPLPRIFEELLKALR